MVNGLLKKKMDIIRLMNLRSVTTRVTDKDENSVVRTNTLLMQTNCVTQFPNIKNHILGM